MSLLMKYTRATCFLSLFQNLKSEIDKQIYAVIAVFISFNYRTRYETINGSNARVLNTSYQVTGVTIPS